MTATSLPVLHVVCANDRRGDPRLHDLLDRMADLGIELDVIFEDPTHHADMGSWAGAVARRLAIGSDRHAPLHVLGYCSGGDLALETLGQLEHQRLDVGYVGFIETRQSPPAVRLRNGDYSRFGMRWSRRVREQIGRLAPPESLPFHRLLGAVFVAMLTGLPRGIGRRIRYRHRYGLMGRGRRSDPRWMAAHLAHDWHYPCIDVPVHLYTTPASMAHLTPGDPSLGLARHLTGGFFVESIPGEHLSCIVAPHQDALIDLIERDRSTVGEIGAPQA